jgi:formylglycine-generating enzyme required for sulfatase activity
VRLRLVFDLKDPAVASVAALPWELLWDPGQEAFLALGPETPIVRCLEVPRRIVAPPCKNPLRVLLVAPRPRDLPALDLHGEARRIQEALGRDGEVRTLPRATAPALWDAVRQDRVDVLHFMGHGSFEEQSGLGVLHLEDETGADAHHSGRSLAELLRDAPSIRLVFLNACSTAQFDRRAGWDPHAGVASALIQGGIPEVVAMQFPITDEAARAFSERFYGEVARGASPEAAVLAGRKAIVAARGRESAEWATPVHFSSLSAREDSTLTRLPRRFRWGRAALVAVPLASLLTFGGFLTLRGLGNEAQGPPAIPEVAACPNPPGLDLDLVPISPGAFLRGSSDGKREEKPRREVILPEGFCMGAFEVTEGLWQAVMGRPEGEEPLSGEALHLPRRYISWQDARAFVDRLNERIGEPAFRLPSEAQWEYAARAGTGTDYSFGDDPDALPQFGNCGRGDAFDGMAAPVGSFPPNPWGLYDIHGNVWEWTADHYRPYPGADWTPNEKEQGERVKRGGSYENAPSPCRSAFRNGADPERREGVDGLRLVRRLEPTP